MMTKAVSKCWTSQINTSVLSREPISRQAFPVQSLRPRSLVKAGRKIQGEICKQGAFYEDPAEDGSTPRQVLCQSIQCQEPRPNTRWEALCYHEGHTRPSHADSLWRKNCRVYLSFAVHGGNTGLCLKDGLCIPNWCQKQMGLYQDPYSDFGRLSMEIFRACAAWWWTSAFTISNWCRVRQGH